MQNDDAPSLDDRLAKAHAAEITKRAALDAEQERKWAQGDFRARSTGEYTKIHETVYAERRSIYQAEIEALGSGQKPAPEPEHKAALVMPFHSFEVVRSIELGPQADMNSKHAEIFLRAKGEEQFLAELRARPDFVEDHWSLFGVHEAPEDDPGQTNRHYRIGDFKTEQDARTVLGGITGDRNYDQRPLAQTAEAALWLGFANDMATIPPVRPPLAERMSQDWSYEQIFNHGSARADVNVESIDRATANVRREHPVQSVLRGEDWVNDQVGSRYTTSDNRPHERLLGTDDQQLERRQRW